MDNNGGRTREATWPLLFPLFLLISLTSPPPPPPSTSIVENLLRLIGDCYCKSARLGQEEPQLGSISLIIFTRR